LAGGWLERILRRKAAHRWQVRNGSGRKILVEKKERPTGGGRSPSPTEGAWGEKKRKVEVGGWTKWEERFDKKSDEPSYGRESGTGGELENLASLTKGKKKREVSGKKKCYRKRDPF